MYMYIYHRIAVCSERYGMGQRSTAWDIAEVATMYMYCTCTHCPYNIHTFMTFGTVPVVSAVRKKSHRHAGIS